MSRVAAYGEWRQRAAGVVPMLTDVQPALARFVVERVLERGGGWLTAVRGQRAAGRGRDRGAALDARHVGRRRRRNLGAPRLSRGGESSRPRGCATRPSSSRRCGSTCRTQDDVRLASATELIRSLGDEIEGLTRPTHGQWRRRDDDWRDRRSDIRPRDRVRAAAACCRSARRFGVPPASGHRLDAGRDGCLAEGSSTASRVQGRGAARRRRLSRCRASHLSADQHLSGDRGARCQSTGRATGVECLRWTCAFESPRTRTQVEH